MLINKELLPLVDMDFMNETHFEDVDLINELHQSIVTYEKDSSFLCAGYVAFCRWIQRVCA